MGLGKTVEILSLVLAHKYTEPPHTLQSSDTIDSDREFEERIDCVCGAYGSAEDDESYDGFWLQCDEWYDFVLISTIFLSTQFQQQ